MGTAARDAHTRKKKNLRGRSGVVRQDPIAAQTFWDNALENFFEAVGDPGGCFSCGEYGHCSTRCPHEKPKEAEPLPAHKPKEAEPLPARKPEEVEPLPACKPEGVEPLPS
ncbi:UNVERIFIED_CONTAM: hypothetical protein FKN15_042365 [Acipenser sinensis]